MASGFHISLLNHRARASGEFAASAPSGNLVEDLVAESQVRVLGQNLGPLGKVVHLCQRPGLIAEVAKLRQRSHVESLTALAVFDWICFPLCNRSQLCLGSSASRLETADNHQAIAESEIEPCWSSLSQMRGRE